MKEIVALMLARLGGNDSPSADDVKAILDSVGIKADDGKLDSLFTDISGLKVSIDEAVKNGMEKLAVIPSGGGGGGGGGEAAAGAGAATGGAKEEVKEEEEESEKESSKAGGNLFGGGGDDSSEEESD
mmetsp:Transcript_43892/g.72495  ORF Transcript_43892/g.72495 Transcript_43892/m.72495 type:complete len:128 (+) Transcript_43892:190-573(+)|eukprot:CAMPEP_0202707364 /NCGR_PEP_ID=MMETSP1385-20130828/19705_1 /ASSEMBLY_ACC=CAM_ASM_000861 /TAXON_ID=933848 /ORGANISM="Elphidium margaritaceum" /LENGTH=127 /DNA_ID=CAMNT_0049366067 /DNA_START=185 /DNA_END=568 /DNA_ORIENTATION=+